MKAFSLTVVSSTAGTLLMLLMSQPARAESLDQQFFAVQLLLDQVQLARVRGDQFAACSAAIQANDQLLDVLPALQNRRPGLDHAALQDRILDAYSRCR